jgi:hypothetical protein
MKVTDNYRAKIKLWVSTPAIVDWEQPEGLPVFGHKRFDSLDEMNAWKREYLLEIARSGGVKWKS